jgi:hypothetical protein
MKAQPSQRMLSMDGHPAGSGSCCSGDNMKLGGGGGGGRGGGGGAAAAAALNDCSTTIHVGFRDFQKWIGGSIAVI